MIDTSLRFTEEEYRANYEQSFDYDGIGNLTRKKIGGSKTNQVRNGMELNYDFVRACLIFCVNDKILLERNPFFSKLNGELVQSPSPIPYRHRPFL